ncbi:MAG: LytTR family DNA-binding domain-containing protein [Polymorphobacter sp.]|uniref:LytTR family DNA-binding domain-containing protein n=1 Tax=Polymorphobacter sp. TaxID=1909290 RepID=UPI003A8B4DAA
MAAAAPHEEAEALARRNGRLLWLIFWLALPLFIGLLLGWSQAGSAKQLGRFDALLFVLSGVLPSWWLYGLIGGALKRLWPALARPALLLLAPTMSSFLLEPLYIGRKMLFGLPHGNMRYEQFGEPLATILPFLQGNLLGIINFPVMGLFFFLMFRFDVLCWPGSARVAAPASDMGAARLPAMADTGVFGRLPARIGRDVQVLVAAEHYLRVVTAAGEAMVLYRLGDAIRDMAAAGIDGVQVHRSYWIATAAIAGHRREGSRLTLETPGGLSVPVSRSYRQALKARTGL